MESPALSARRATIEDLPALQALWQRAGLPWQELEAYVAEFLVVTRDDGAELLAALGLLVEHNDALLHPEALAETEDADELRAALWRRVQILARNQGIQRLWTQEDADYWRTVGFALPAPPTVAGTTATFVDKSAAWLLCEMIDPDKAKQIVSEQMAIWQAARAQEAAELQAKIRRFRNFAMLLASLVTISTLAIFLYVILRHPEIMQRFLHGGRRG